MYLLIVVVATGTITESDREEMSRLQLQVQECGEQLTEPVNPTEQVVDIAGANESTETNEPAELNKYVLLSEPGEVVESVKDIEPINVVEAIDITEPVITTKPVIVVEPIEPLEPPDRTKENEAFIIEVEEDEKAYLEAIRKQQQVAAERYEQGRKEREAWFEEFRRANGLLSSDEEEFAKAEAEENRRYTKYVEFLELEGQKIVNQPKDEQNRTIERVRSTIKQYAEEGLIRKKRNSERTQLIRSRHREQDKREKEQKEKLKREREAFQRELKAKEEQRKQEELTKRRK